MKKIKKDLNQYLGNSLDTIYLSKLIFDDINPLTAFASKLNGNGMINAGLSSGDTAVFSEADTLKNGQIGIFYLKDLNTPMCKRYYRDGNKVILSFDDSSGKEPFIRDESDVIILGKLEYIIKRIQQWNEDY